MNVANCANIKLEPRLASAVIGVEKVSTQKFLVPTTSRSDPLALLCMPLF